MKKKKALRRATGNIVRMQIKKVLIELHRLKRKVKEEEKIGTRSSKKKKSLAIKGPTFADKLPPVLPATHATSL